MRGRLRLVPPLALPQTVLTLWGRIRRLIGDAAKPADENQAARDTVLFALDGEIAHTYFLIRYGDEELPMLGESIELRKPAL